MLSIAQCNNPVNLHCIHSNHSKIFSSIYEKIILKRNLINNCTQHITIDKVNKYIVILLCFIPSLRES